MSIILQKSCIINYRSELFGKMFMRPSLSKTNFSLRHVMVGSGSPTAMQSNVTLKPCSTFWFIGSTIILGGPRI